MYGSRSVGCPPEAERVAVSSSGFIVSCGGPDQGRMQALGVVLSSVLCLVLGITLSQDINLILSDSKLVGRSSPGLPLVIHSSSAITSWATTKTVRSGDFEQLGLGSVGNGSL